MRGEMAGRSSDRKRHVKTDDRNRDTNEDVSSPFVPSGSEREEVCDSDGAHPDFDVLRDAMKLHLPFAYGLRHATPHFP
jgi:hypothetical protein